MNLTPEEIDKVEDAGVLNNEPVKMIRTKGGFWMAVGRPKGKHKQEALTAGSHPAIVKYNLEKQYPDYQPALMKSEYFSDNIKVDKHSHYLSDDLRKSGHDIYSIQNGQDIEFQITKHNAEVYSVKGKVEDKTIILNDLKIAKDFSRGMAGATTEKAIEIGAQKIRVGVK